MAPDVSVILPTHNRAEILPRAIDSVLSQTYKDLELVVVDDASTDDTLDVLAEIEDPRLRVVARDENAGQSAARNTGAEAARAPLLSYIDSDAVWRPDKLEKQVQAYRRAEGSDTVVFCPVLVQRGDGTRRVPRPGRPVPSGDPLPELSKGNFVDTSTLLVPKRLVEEVGGWDPDLDRLVDWDLVLRLTKSGEFVYVDEVLVDTERQEDSITNTEPLVPSYRRVLEKNPEAREHGTLAFAEILDREGDRLLHEGRMQQGRRYLLEAVRLDPQLRRVGKLAVSLGGAMAYRGVHRWVKGLRESLARESVLEVADEPA